MRLKCGPDTDVYSVPLKVVADVMDQAVQDKQEGRHATADTGEGEPVPDIAPGEAGGGEGDQAEQGKVAKHFLEKAAWYSEQAERFENWGPPRPPAGVRGFAGPAQPSL